MYNSLKSSAQKNYPRLYIFCEQYKSIFKYGFAGGLATAVDLVALYIFHELWGLSIIVATTAAFLVAFLISFSLQKYWTFRDKSQDRLAGQLTIYLANGLIGLYLNGFLMHILVENFGLWYLGSQILVNLLIAVQNYLVYRFIVFKKKNHETVS